VEPLQERSGPPEHCASELTAPPERDYSEWILRCFAAEWCFHSPFYDAMIFGAKPRTKGRDEWDC